MSDLADMTLKGLLDAQRAEYEGVIEAQEAHIKALEDVLRVAKELADFMEGYTGCRSDDDWVWSAQAKINDALTLSKAPSIK